MNSLKKIDENILRLSENSLGDPKYNLIDNCQMLKCLNKFCIKI